MKVPAMIYTHISNGDYNGEHEDFQDAANDLDWEMNQGCQLWAIITPFKLTPDEHRAIAAALLPFEKRTREFPR